MSYVQESKNKTKILSFFSHGGLGYDRQIVVQMIKMPEKGEHMFRGRIKLL